MFALVAIEWRVVKQPVTDPRDPNLIYDKQNKIKRSEAKQKVAWGAIGEKLRLRRNDLLYF